MSEKDTIDQERPAGEEEVAAAGEEGAEGSEPPDDGGSDDEGGAAAGSDDAGASPPSLSAELDHLQAEFDELNDRHLRLAAEFNNYRRRQETQMTEAWARAQADLVGRLVEVLDDLQRVAALDPADEAVTVESIVEGIDLVERKFVRKLEEAGVELVDPAEGDPFDPSIMEAMMKVPDESGERDDRVAAVFEKGYVFRGHLVRAARVSVYKS